MDKRPNSKVNLDRAIQRIYGNTVVGQFLPGCQTSAGTVRTI